MSAPSLIHFFMDKKMDIENRMKEEISCRVNQLRQRVESSANNHNALVGRLAEAMYLLQIMESKEQEEKGCKEEEQNDEVPDDRNNTAS